MAALNHEPDRFVSCVSHNPEYIQAFFRAPDDLTSRSAPASRVTPDAAPFATNILSLNLNHARASPENIFNAAQQPERESSAIETAEELVRMRAGASTAVSPMLHGGDRRRPQLLGSGSGATDTAPRGNMDPHNGAPADHPTVSTSSEEAVGRHSDVFSADDNSDTITDPDMDSLDRNPHHLPLKAPANLDVHVISTLNQGMIASPGLPAPVSRQSLAREMATNSPAERCLAVEGAPQRQANHLYDQTMPVLPAPFPAGHHQYQPLTSIASNMDRCICRPNVAVTFLNTLDSCLPTDVQQLTQHYAQFQNDLCPTHQYKYAQSLTAAVKSEPASASSPSGQPFDQTATDNVYGKTGTGTRWTYPRRKRATSVPGVYEIEFLPPPKKPRSGEEAEPTPQVKEPEQQPEPQPQPEPRPEQQPEQRPEQPTEAKTPDPETQNGAQQRPLHDVGHDEAYRLQVLEELARNFTDRKIDDRSRGETTNRYIHDILSKCIKPNTDPRLGPVDVGFLSGEEAATTVESGTIKLPIIVEGQQQFQWKGDERPISELFRRMEDLTRYVSVQIPSNNFDLPSYETKSLDEVQQRFSSGKVSEDPWNILDLRSPLPPSILPRFLTGENCQLLPRIRDSLLMGECAERTKASKDEWNEWTELLEWVLMSEGGHNTAPHMDSHGWSTWITIQEGRFGFGWLSRPTDQEQDGWMADPLGYAGGNWRFLILKPGQTVFFPSGTIHFVFRLHAQQTLALGGHLLQWSALERWVQVILNQLRNPNITNEDLGTAPLKYIRNARALVSNRIKTSRVEVMGGMPAVQKFLMLSNASTFTSSFEAEIIGC